MAESPLIDTKSDLTIAQHVAKLSDRAIQRITGGNAFLRGRLYARRNAVVDLNASGTTASAKILVRADQPYETQLGLTSEGQIISHCSCPAWRGPSGHCKHVAAVLVALRDRERPPRPKGEEAPAAAAPAASPARNGASNGALNGSSSGGAPAVSAREPRAEREPREARESKAQQAAAAAANALEIGPGGKRRRSRRRRRAGEGTGTLEVVPSAAPIVTHRASVSDARSNESRGSLEAWLPPNVGRPQELEFRLAVRPASIAVTTVLAGTRQAVALNDALAGFASI